MPSGNTTTGILADALPTIIASARVVREFGSVMTQVVDNQTLKQGTGLDWIENRLEAIEAQTVTEDTILDNPQQLQNVNFAIQPIVSAVQLIVTDRVMQRLSQNAAGLLGQAAQNAMERKKDKDGLSQFSGASLTFAGAGVTLVNGHISAAVSNIMGNVTETGQGAGPLATVLHPFQVKDLQDEVVSGIGANDNVPVGMTEEFYRNGFQGSLFTTSVWEDGNIEIDTLDDAQGAVFARDAIVLVQGFAPRVEIRRRPEIGGGADEMFHFDEFRYGIRRSVWIVRILSDATAPTS